MLDVHPQTVRGGTLPVAVDTPRILLLEDSDLNAVVFVEYLSIYGDFDVTIAKTIHEADGLLEGSGDDTCDLCILDVMLPDGLSLDLARKLIEQHQAVALYTAKLTEGDKVLYGRMPLAHVFEKPMSIGEFEAGMRRIGLVES